MSSFFNPSNIRDYFSRINYSGGINPSLITLQQLQTAHLYHVPFENLDIHYGVPIHLDIERIYQKVVINNRGGFCYELNGLFHELLLTLGFKVERMSGRVYANDIYGQEFDHLFNWVTIDEQAYIVDVGFGEFSLLPLSFQIDREQNDPRGTFIIQQHDDEYFRISRRTDGEFIPEHIFKKQAHPYEAFSEMCAYHQTNPASHFMKHRLVSLATPSGRVSITDNRIKIRTGKKIEELELTNEQQFNAALKTYFQFEIPLKK